MVSVKETLKELRMAVKTKMEAAIKEYEEVTGDHIVNFRLREQADGSKQVSVIFQASEQ